MRHLPSTSLVSSKLGITLFSNLVSSKRSIFLQTKIALACRVDSSDDYGYDGYTDERRADLLKKVDNVNDLEKQLCSARSVLTCTNMVFDA